MYSHGACTDPGFVAAFLAGDSVEIEMAKDPGFEHVDVRLVVGSTAFVLGPQDLSALLGYTGRSFGASAFSILQAPGARWRSPSRG